MQIISYNINGLKKFLVQKDTNQTSLYQYFKPKNVDLQEKSVNCTYDFSSLIQLPDIDVICLQETRLQANFDLNSLKFIKKFYPYTSFNCNTSTIKSYSGVAILSKHPFVNVYNNLDYASKNLQQKFSEQAFSKEGRLITVEFDSFYLINLYAPNSKIDFSRLKERSIWEECISSYICELSSNTSKAIVIAGDFNVSLVDSKTLKLYPGCHPVEKQWFLDFIEKTKLVDCFNTKESQIPYSHIYGLIKLDYFLCSNNLQNSSYVILSEYKLSDHCPLKLYFEVPQVLEQIAPAETIKQEIVDDNLSITLIDNFCSENQCKMLWENIINSGDFKRSHTNKDGSLSKKRNKIVYGSIPTYSFVYKNQKLDFNIIHWYKVPLIKELAQKCSDVTGEEYNTCTVQYYNNGAVDIKPHRDKEMAKGTYIVSLSLGATRMMKFENSKKVINCSLKQGMLCIINPPTNEQWLHSIPCDQTTEPRISIIFRKV